MGAEASVPGTTRPSWRRLGDAIMVRHTLFSLPWALGALLLVTSGRPSPLTLVWVVLAALGARTAANAFNRLADEAFDAANPRTAGRDLPAGRVSRLQLGVLTAVSALVVVGAVAQLNLLCLALLPAAGVLVFGYSYTKRFTWLCHFWLGATCALAPLGAFLAFAGHFEPRFLVLWGTVALWIAGFDILYATQDIAFDRQAGLKSLPARFGAQKAFWVSRACHLAAVGGLGLTVLLWPVGPVAWLVPAAVGGLLAAEHLVARGGTERHLRVASYGLNEVVGVTVLVLLAAAVYTGPGFQAGPTLGTGAWPAPPAGWVQWLSTDVFTPDFWAGKGLGPW